jgi:hypothetical protein
MKKSYIVIRKGGEHDKAGDHDKSGDHEGH